MANLSGTSQSDCAFTRLCNSMKKFAKYGNEPCGGSLSKLSLGALCLAAAACGGSTAPPASAPPAPSAVASSPVPAPITSSAPAPSSDATKSPPPSEPTPQSNATKPEPAAISSPISTAEASQPSQSPSLALTAARVAFLIDYANSDPKNKAIAACEKHEDSAAKAACMQKARSAFLPDVLVFQKDKKGHLTLTIYKRNESELKEVYIASIAFADETPNSLKLKFKGGGSGQRPLFKNTNSPTLNMPNDYTIEIDDSEFGKLRYDAKIGLVGK